MSILDEIAEEELAEKITLTLEIIISRKSEQLCREYLGDRSDHYKKWGWPRCHKDTLECYLEEKALQQIWEMTHRAETASRTHVKVECSFSSLEQDRFERAAKMLGYERFVDYLETCWDDNVDQLRLIAYEFEIKEKHA